MALPDFPRAAAGWLSPTRSLRMLSFAPQRPAASYAIAAVMGMLFVAMLFPLDFLAGNGEFFTHRDVPQHVTGWLFYKRDSWHFPLLRTVRLNYPDGVSIAFTDSIPLAALLLKPFARWLPVHFHYLGAWHAVAFVAQALAATFLIRSLGARSVLATVVAVGFALNWPALLWRLGHPSLMTHALILLALGLYFRARRAAPEPAAGRRSAIAFILLCIAALLIHPYFLVFCYGVFLASLADRAIAGAGWARQVPLLMLSVAAMLGAGIVFGYFGKGTATFGFGEYSMNLDAPWCGSRFYSCVPEGVRQPFEAFHFVDATGGQYEGFNYLGAGLILLLPFALVRDWPAWRAMPRRYPALLTALLLFFAYALSNRIFFGMHELLQYRLPAALTAVTGTFRASGRFFWVFGYALLFATLASLSKQPTRRSALLMLLALGMQWADVEPLRQRIITQTGAAAVEDLVPWAETVREIDQVRMFPAFGCGDSDVTLYWRFQRIAAHFEKLLDTGYIARPDVDCARNRRSFEGALEARQLYVTAATNLANAFLLPAGFATAIARGECAQWQTAVLCRSGANFGAWEAAGLPGKVTRVAALAPRSIWPASVLPGNVGTLSGGRRVASDHDARGALSFGPYIALPPGRYRFGITYVSDAAPTQRIGYWDLAAALDHQASRQLAAGPLVGTLGEERVISGLVTIDAGTRPLEIRTFFTGDGNLQLIGISLEVAK